MSDRYDSVRHFRSTYEAARPAFAFADSDGDVAAWQFAFRPRLRAALGLDIMESALEGHTVRAERESSEDLGDLVRERWHVWTEPTVPLPCYLIRRKDAAGRLPVVLTPHGHNQPDIYAGVTRNDEEQRSMVEGERDIAVQAAREGYLAVAPTTRGFGETRTEDDRENDALSSCAIQLRHALLVGRTPIGERVWDMMRVIDWVLQRDDVDGGRIAITGNSGGGTVSLWASAIEERITVAVPSCYFCTFVGSIGSIHHCPCNYVPGILQLGEMHDVAGLIAPRPFCAIAGKADEIFPIDHVRTSFERLRAVYDAAGAGERCELYVGDGGHRFYSAGAWPFVRKWFDAAG